MRFLSTILITLMGLTSWSRGTETIENRERGYKVVFVSKNPTNLDILINDSNEFVILDSELFEVGNIEISFVGEEIAEPDGEPTTPESSVTDPGNEPADPDGEPRILTLLERVNEILAPYKK